MFIVDLDNKVVHDQSRPQYECQITKIPKESRKKLFTVDGMKRFLDDPINKEYNACKYCMPDQHQFDMTSIFKS